MATTVDGWQLFRLTGFSSPPNPPRDQFKVYTLTSLPWTTSSGTLGSAAIVLEHQSGFLCF